MQLNFTCKFTWLQCGCEREREREWSQWCMQANHQANGIIAVSSGSCVLHSDHQKCVHRTLFPYILMNSNESQKCTHPHTECKYNHTYHTPVFHIFLMATGIAACRHTHTADEQWVLAEERWLASHLSSKWDATPARTLVPKEAVDNQSTGQQFTHRFTRRSGLTGLLIKWWTVMCNLHVLAVNQENSFWLTKTASETICRISFPTFDQWIEICLIISEKLHYKYLIIF